MRTRLGVGGLEDRTVPSTVTVARIEDAGEGWANGVFRFARTGDVSAELAVTYSVESTATPDTDYTSLGTTVTLMFAADQATADVLVEALHDGVYDPGETVTVTIEPDTGYTVGTQNTATVTIYDDAAHTFTLGAAAGTIWYDIAWEQVDPEAAESTATLRNFTLAFGGQTFTAGTPGFSAGNPVAVFANGDFQYIRFDAVFGTPVAGYERVAADNGQVTGYDATTHLPSTTADMEDKELQAMTINFASMGWPGGLDEVVWHVRVKVDGTWSNVTQVAIARTATVAQVTDSMWSAFRSLGLHAEVATPPGGVGGGPFLAIKGKPGKEPGEVEILLAIGTRDVPAKPGITRIQGAGAAIPVFTWDRKP